MANMSVAYRGPDPSLVTLTNELRAHYGNPARTYEFVTGYKAPSNFSGHNPDSNGVVHAVDIFTDDHGNIPEAEGRALAERLRLVGKATGRFAYLIHDMSAGAPQPMIAGDHTGWLWAAYGGADAHSDHIHLSIADGYWGDPCNVPAYVTNDTSRWGVTGGANPQANTITPIPEEGFLMALSDEDQLEVRDNMRKIVGWINTIHSNVAPINTAAGPVSLRQMVADGTRAGQAAAANTAAIKRGGKNVSLRQEVADIKTSTLKTEPVIVDIAKAVKADDVDGTK